MPDFTEISYTRKQMSTIFNSFNSVGRSQQISSTELQMMEFTILVLL